MFVIYCLVHYMIISYHSKVAKLSALDLKSGGPWLKSSTVSPARSVLSSFKHTTAKYTAK